jgi:chromosome segregation ATPase
METLELPVSEQLLDDIDEEISGHDLSRTEYLRYIISARHERDELRQELERATFRADDLQQQLQEANTRNEELERDLADFERETSDEYPLDETELNALNSPHTEADSPGEADEPGDDVNETNETDGDDGAESLTEATATDDRGSDDELADCAAQLRSYLG